jgi:hypothetical protein
MTPEQIYARLDGMIGFQTGSADGGSIQGNQSVCDWVMLVKALLKTASFRYLDDLEFGLLDDVDTTGVPQADATHIIAALVEMVTTIATDAYGWIHFDDADTNTFVGSSALDNTTILAIGVKDVTTTGVSEFYPWIFLAGATGVATATYSRTGIPLSTGLTVSGDGMDAGAFATDACRAWILYRT